MAAFAFFAPKFGKVVETMSNILSVCECSLEYLVS